MISLIVWMGVILFTGAFFLAYWVRDNWTCGWSTTEMFFFIILFVVEVWGIYEFYGVIT